MVLFTYLSLFTVSLTSLKLFLTAILTAAEMKQVFLLSKDLLKELSSMVSFINRQYRKEQSM